MHPFSAMDQIISRCEQALEREDWSEINQKKTCISFFRNSRQAHTGPNLVGVVDTGMFKSEFVREGLYSFFNPIGLVEVSELHVPHELN